MVRIKNTSVKKSGWKNLPTKCTLKKIQNKNNEMERKKRAKNTIEEELSIIETKVKYITDQYNRVKKISEERAEINLQLQRRFLTLNQLTIEVLQNSLYQQKIFTRTIYPTIQDTVNMCKENQVEL
tara:strand:+ start:104 stop:481 length:378 start_codon:yes stop_codon:yes gene_type:complete